MVVVVVSGVVEGAVVAVASVVAVGVSSAGARSSTRPTEVPPSPRVSVEPFSSSIPVTVSRPSRNTTTVAPIQRPHGRFGGGTGDVPPPPPPVPSRRVGPAPAPP